MLSVKELKHLAGSLSEKAFHKQLGPFALVQRPEGDGGPGSLEHTAMANREDISQGVLALLFEFEDLMVATLPPLDGEDQLTVGRLPDNDLVVDDPSVSKRHAVLRWNDAQKTCTVNDLGSKNGSFLNDCIRISRETVLKDGDIISFGDAQFWYLLSETLYQKLSNQSGSSKLGSHSG